MAIERGDDGRDDDRPAPAIPRRVSMLDVVDQHLGSAAQVRHFRFVVHPRTSPIASQRRGHIMFNAAAHRDAALRSRAHSPASVLSQ